MNRQFFWLIVCIITVISRPLFSQPAQKLVLSLKQCEEMALKNNPLMKDAELSVEKARIKEHQAVAAAILPKFELSNIWGALPRARARYTSTGVLISPDTATGLSDLRVFTQLDVDLVQPIYTFGKLSNLRQAAEFGVDVSEAGVEKQEAEIRLLIRKLYWGIVLGKELQEVIQDAQKKVAEAEDKLNEKLDEGSEDVSQNDLFKLQIFKYEVNKKAREIEENMAIARHTLLATLGVDKSVEFEPKAPYLDPVSVVLDSLPVYIALAMERRPELVQLRAGMGATRALVGVSRSDFYPQFFLAGGLKYNYAPGRDDPRNPWVYNPTNFFRPGLVLGIRLNLNFSQTRSKVRLAENKYQTLSNKENLLLHKVELDIRKKYLAVLNAEKNIRESEKALKASENWLRSVSMSFDLGLAEVKELIDAYKANSTMKGEHLRNIFTYNVLIAELSNEIGYDLYSQTTTNHQE